MSPSANRYIPLRRKRKTLSFYRSVTAIIEEGEQGKILLGYLMWRSRLLPRPLVMIGLIGGLMALLAGIGVLLGAWDTSSGLPVALTAPEAIWEFSLSVWLLVKGFRPSPILTGPPVVPGQAR